MSAFKNFFQDRKPYISEKEKANLKDLLKALEANIDCHVAMITRQDGAKGLAVMKNETPEKGVNLDDGYILSGIMEGENKRIKEIFRYLTKKSLVELVG